MSEIDSRWDQTEDEVFSLIEALVETASDSQTPAGFLTCVEDDLVGIRDAYDLTAIEMSGLGARIAERLAVKSVLCRDEWGQPFIQFFILPKEAP